MGFEADVVELILIVIAIRYLGWSSDAGSANEHRHSGIVFRFAIGRVVIVGKVILHYSPLWNIFYIQNT